MWHYDLTHSQIPMVIILNQYIVQINQTARNKSTNVD
jgi:hypothetical protein